MPENHNKAAVFLDLDGVMLEKEFGESFAVLCMDLLRKRIIGFRDVTWIWIRSRFWRRGIAVNANTDAIARRVAKRLAGIERNKMMEAEINTAKHLRMMHGAKEFMEWLKNHFNVYIVTGSSQGIADYFGRLFGVEAFGTKLETRHGFFTGRVEMVMNQNNKASTVKSIARRDKLDLSKSFALGDQIEDSKMLGLVGHPVCVRPGNSLIRFNRGKWKTVHSLADAMAIIRQTTEKK